MSKPIEITARYRSTIWRSEDGECVIIRGEGERGKPLTMRGPPDAGPALVPGLAYRWHGQWETHPKHGEQFRFVAFSATALPTREGVVAYLKAVAAGVGDVRAGALWDRFGPLAVAVLRENPETVAHAKIMPVEVARAASDSLIEAGAFEGVKIELMGMLAGRGFQLSAVIRQCLQRWGSRAGEIVRRNPYAMLLAGMPSVGWQRADKLYLELGHPPHRLKRLALLALHKLRDDGGGHTWLPAGKVGAAIEGEARGKACPVRALRLAIRAGLLARRRDKSGQVWLADAEAARDEAAAAGAIGGLVSWVDSRPLASEPSGDVMSVGT